LEILFIFEVVHIQKENRFGMIVSD